MALTPKQQAFVENWITNKKSKSIVAKVKKKLSGDLESEAQDFGSKRDKVLEELANLHAALVKTKPALKLRLDAIDVAAEKGDFKAQSEALDVLLKDARTAQSDQLQLNAEIQKAKKAIAVLPEQVDGKEPVELTALKSSLDLVGTEAKSGDEFKQQLKALKDLGPEAARKMEAFKNVATIRHKPVYEDMRRRIKQAIDDLTPLPGAKPACLELMALLETGGQLAATGGYEAAVKAMEGYGKVVKRGLSAADDAREGKGNKPLAACLINLRQAISDYEEIAGIGDAAGVQSALRSIDAGLLSIDTVSEDMKAARTEIAIRQFNETAQALKGKTLVATTLKGQVDLLQERLSPLVKGLKKYSPIDVLGPLLTEFNAAQAMAGAQRFELAKSALESLDGRLSEAARIHKEAFDEWEKFSTECTNLRKDGLPPERSKTSVPAPLERQLSAMHAIVDMTLRSELIPQNEYLRAMELIRAQGLLEDLRDATRLVVNQRSGRDLDADPAFKGDIAKTQSALRKLRAGFDAENSKALVAIAKLKTDGGFIAEFEAERAGLASSFEKAEARVAVLAEKTDDKQPAVELTQQDREERLREFGVQAELLKAKMASLVERVVAIEGDALEASKRHAEADKLEGPAFEEARKKTKAALDLLAVMGVPEGDPRIRLQWTWPTLDADFKKLLASAAEGRYETPKMGMLQKYAEDSVGLVENTLKRQREGAASDASDLTRQIANLRKNQSNHAPYFQQMQDRLDAAEMKCRSKVFKLLGEGLDELQALKKEAADLLKDDRSFANFYLVKKELEALTLEVNTAEFNTYLPAVQAALREEIVKLLPGRLTSLSPAAARQEIMKMMDRVNAELREPTAKAKADFEQMKKDAAALKIRAEACLKEAAPTVYASVLARLEAVEKMKEPDAARGTLEIRSLRIILVRAEDTAHPELLVGMESSAKLVAVQAERDLAKFEADVEVFKNGAQSQAKALHDEVDGSERNDELYKLIATRLSEAEKAAKAKPFDPVAAAEKLRVAYAAATAFVGNPYKAGTAGRKAVAAANQNWEAAVSALLKGLADLGTKIRSDCAQFTYTPEELQARKAASADEINAAYIKAGEAALAPIQTLFSAATFRHATELLSAKPDKKDQDARREAKEHAILLVRRYQRQLESHPLLRALGGNPFLELPLGGISQALKNLNLALLTS